ncbi:hypothetical protein GEV33_011380 [Tenebrio molitor]|uniref:Uncharacterized protein n=1 Tax=Tenebrio molitor TaxID=7067 RepID=A0A8J6HBF5_TENMO|nr:hypothetical protein GEV33_011380 [Tenebrio molitor]
MMRASTLKVHLVNYTALQDRSTYYKVKVQFLPDGRHLFATHWKRWERMIIKCPGSSDGTSKNEITCKYANEQFRRPTPDPKKIQNKQIAPPAAFSSFPGEGKPEGHIYPRLRDRESVRATCRGVEGRRARRSIDGTRLEHHDRNELKDMTEVRAKGRIWVDEARGTRTTPGPGFFRDYVAR